MLKQIDIFGSRYDFYVLGHSAFKSSLGGFISFLSLIAMITLFIMLGKNFYKGENPIISMGKEYSKEYFNFTLTPKNFLFGFQIGDQDSNPFERPDLFYIEPRFIEYKKSKEGVNVKTADRVLKYHKCTESDSNFHPEFHSNQLYTYYCFNEINNEKGLDIGGLWDGQELRYIKIKVRHCSTAGIYNIENNITCSTNRTEIEYHMNNYKYFQFFIQNYFVNSNDYQDPFKLSLNVLYETMDLKVQKKLYYYFKQGVFEDKKGWFTEESDKKLLIGIDRTRTDFMNSVADYFSTTYYETNLYFDKIIETYNRRYMKIQEVIANIGGIMKFIFFINSILISFYNSFYMYSSIIYDISRRKVFKDSYYNVNIFRLNKDNLGGGNNLEINNNNNYENNNNFLETNQFYSANSQIKKEKQIKLSTNMLKNFKTNEKTAKTLRRKKFLSEKPENFFQTSENFDATNLPILNNNKSTIHNPYDNARKFNADSSELNPVLHNLKFNNKPTNCSKNDHLNFNYIEKTLIGSKISSKINKDNYLNIYKDFYNKNNNNNDNSNNLEKGNLIFQEIIGSSRNQNMIKMQNRNEKLSVSKLDLAKGSEEEFHNSQNFVWKGFSIGYYVRSLMKKRSNREKPLLYFIKMKKTIDANLEIVHLLSLLISLKDFKEEMIAFFNLR